MIRDIITADITDPRIHSGDIIIGMNTKLDEVSAIGRPFAKNISVLEQIKLGSVLSFQFDENRMLHMLICHKIGSGGWKNADRYVRYCLDYLWQQHALPDYGIVQIGKGSIGQRDGADVPAIRTAMANSFLEMNLFILPEAFEARDAVTQEALIPCRVWDIGRGEREINFH